MSCIIYFLALLNILVISERIFCGLTDIILRDLAQLRSKRLLWAEIQKSLQWRVFSISE